MSRLLTWWVWGGAFVAAMWVRPVFAYPVYDSTAGITKYERDAAAVRRGTPGDSSNGGGWVDSELAFSGEVGRDPNAFCPAGDPDCNENPVTPPEPIIRETTINSFSPMTGFGATMNSMAYANQAAGLLVSPLSILKIAWALTEPAIGLGNDSAMAQANMWMQNRYLSDEMFVRHARLNPHADFVLQTYRDCIGKLMGPLEPGATLPAGPSMSWVEAVSRCQGGDAIFSSATRPFINTAPDGFDFSSNSGNLTGAPSLSISALDILFNPVIKAGGPAAAELPAVRASFEKLVGDVVIEIGRGDTGARILRASRVPPTESPSRTHREMTLEAYHSLHELMQLRCEKVRTGSIPPTTGAMPPELRQRLSVRGYDFTQIAEKGFYFLFERQYAGTPENQRPCDELRSWDPAQPTSLEGIRARGSASDMNRMYFKLASRVALARRLGALREAEAEVLRLSGGEVEMGARRAVLDAIYEVAQTTDLVGEYIQVVEELVALQREVLAAESSDGRARQGASIG